ncbi:myelin-associated glycoprotein [Dunckerocampus dactyliophorus]|uniref:myelin-associated glycoprotein n=1 Tax=Dunckerocampus dactyliophorus TaxID=161453 RepID=UPI002407648D|nr:myelin-associated glycoprotein [Dunckerocampus dactyliophorus]
MAKERKMMLLFLLLAASGGAVSSKWTASVVGKIDALVSSCVVLPCSFSHPKEQLPTSRLRGIWHRPGQGDQRFYHQDRTKILENFRDRTQLLGHLGQGNCSLEITQIKDSDNGPFCFRIELARTEDDTDTPDKFSFDKDCVTLKMLSEPPKPTLIHGSTAIQGHSYIVSCSVSHTCPTHVPTLTWNRGASRDVMTIHKEVHAGFWEVQSILTIVPKATDDHAEVTCTAMFYGQTTSSKTFTLFVKRKESHHHIIIPTVVAVGTTVIFGGICMLMAKKYKRRISELQHQDSRLSRFSGRRPREEIVALNHLPSSSKSAAGPKFCKPFVPSPKSQPKSYNYKEDLTDADDYENTADLNVYGNC